MSAATQTTRKSAPRKPAAKPATKEETGTEEAGTEEVAVDLSEILPNPESLVVSGIPVVVQRIKMRELMLIVRAFTDAIGSDMKHFNLNPKSPDFDSQLVGMMMMVIPRAMDDFVDLFVRIVEAKNPRKADELRSALDNPEIEDAIDIAAVVIRQEKDDLVRLWGKLQVLLGATAALYRTGKKDS